MITPAQAWAREAGSGWTEDPKTVAAVAHAVGQVGEADGSLDVAILRETVARDLPALLKRLDAMLR